MLRLEVGTPVYLEVELVIVLLQDLHRFGIADPAEVGGHHVGQAFLEPLIHEAVEEVDLVGAALQHPADDVLDHGLGHIHIPRQIGKGHLRLDHPELGGVALGVGILRPEGGTEGIHVTKGHGEVLGIQLAGHGEAGLFAEEVLAVIHLPVFGPGNVVEIQRRHLKHLAGAFAVGAGDDGSVDIYEATALEELVDGVGCYAADPEGSGEQVGAGPQMLDGPQELHAVALFLQRIVRGGLALHLDGGGLYLQRLLGLRRQHHGATDDESGAHVLPGDLLIIIQLISGHDHLQILEAGAVIELDEPKGFHIPDGAGPAAHGDFLAVQLFLVGKKGSDLHSLHRAFLLALKSV